MSGKNHRVSSFFKKMSFLALGFSVLISIYIFSIADIKKIGASSYGILLIIDIFFMVASSSLMKYWTSALFYELARNSREAAEGNIQKIIADIKRITDYPDKNLEIFIDLANNGFIFLEGFPVPLKRGDFNVTPEKIRRSMEEEKRKCEEALDSMLSPLMPKRYAFWEKLLRVKTT